MWKGLLVVLALCLASAAGAAPKAESSAECANLADIALVARAHAEGGVTPEKSAAMLGRIYTLEDPRSAEFLRAILGAAHADKRSPEEFANALGKHCMSTRGNMEGFFGVPL